MNNQSLPLPVLTEVMATAELFEAVKEAHAISKNEKKHVNIARVNGAYVMMDNQELEKVEKSPTFSLVYSTDRGFVFTPIAGEYVYGEAS